MLFALLMVPLFVGLYGWQQRRRQRITAAYGKLGLIQTANGRSLSWQRHLPPLFFLLGLILLLLALARPEAVVSLPRVEGTVILAFDVSGSMAAVDLEPSRIEAAKAAAREFVERQPPSVLVGLVAFSDSGFTVQAPTNDQEAIFTTMHRLGPELGTSLASGIYASLNALIAESESSPRLYSNLTPEPTPEPTPVPEGVYTSAVIVLLTDGENNERPDPLEAAQLAADRGVRIYTVGIGSAAGIDLELDGFTVHTQLNEPMLQRIAQISGGAYYNAQNEEDLQAIYENLEPEFVIKPEKMEVTSIFAGFSLLLLLLGGLFSLLWFGRLP